MNSNKMKEYQKRYIENHSKLITCDICNKTFKEYRLRYHPFIKKHLKALELQKKKKENNDNKNKNSLIVYFD